jgi:rhodanese-related sulfurtransferase
MPVQIGRERVQHLLAEGAQLVEVLPRRAYQTVHLPGAASIPVTSMDRVTTAGLDRDRPLVVYCFDTQ